MSDMTNRIDKMLRQRGIKKQDFYDAIGISSMTYSKWSRDLVTPRPENIRMISDYFSVSIPYLQYGIEEPEQKKIAAPASGDLTDAQIELLRVEISINQSNPVISTVTGIFVAVSTL